MIVFDVYRVTRDGEATLMVSVLNMRESADLVVREWNEAEKHEAASYVYEAVEREVGE